MESARALIDYLDHMSAHTRYLTARADMIDLLVAWAALKNGRRRVQFPADEESRLLDRLDDARKRLRSAATEMELDFDSISAEVTTEAIRVIG